MPTFSEMRSHDDTAPIGRKLVLVIEDDATLNRLLVRQIERAGFAARGVLRWADAERLVEEEEPALVVLDLRLPDVDGIDVLPTLAAVCPVVVLTADGAIEHAVRALRGGASDYLTKPVRAETLEFAIRRSLEEVSLRRDGQFWKERLHAIVGGRMVGASAAFLRAAGLVAEVAPSEETVLILGENGVGKEMFARAVHDASGRARAGFVTIDCASPRAATFESEVFGHERGAVAGAERRRTGLLELADGGTVFLDDIGEATPEIQAKLLRVLETGTFRRLGGSRDLQTDVRFVAATSRDLSEMVRAGRFRADLHYRLSRSVVWVPPLRERGDDVVAIAENLLADRGFHRGVEKHLGAEAIAALRAYSWPGNIRELRCVIERAVLLSGPRREIDAEALRLGRDGRGGKEFVLSFDAPPTLEEIEKTHLRQLLERPGISRAEIAQILGISERNTYRLIAKYGLR